MIFIIITLIDLNNPDKINKIRKPWSGNPDCLVKTNVTGSNHLKQVILWINLLHLTVLIKTNTFLIVWEELIIFCHINSSMLKNFISKII